MEMGPEAAPTQGLIYQPMQEGRGVDNGDERMKQNKKEIKDKK
jgi:hypothetical protein